MEVVFTDVAPSGTCFLCSNSTDGSAVGHVADRVTHAFHRSCISSWFALGNPVCPVCYATVTNFYAYMPVNNVRHEDDADVMGTTVMYAAATGHLPQVQAILKNVLISERCRGGAVRNAAGTGHLDTVRYLQGDGPISERDRKLAIELASANGHANVRDELKAMFPL